MLIEPYWSVTYWIIAEVRNEHTGLYWNITRNPPHLFAAGNLSEASRHLCCSFETKAQSKQTTTYWVSPVLHWVLMYSSTLCVMYRVSLHLSQFITPLICLSSSSNSESHSSSSKLSYSESRGPYRSAADDDEEEYRRQLSEQTRRGYYNPQKYNDTEL